MHGTTQSTPNEIPVNENAPDDLALYFLQTWKLYLFFKSTITGAGFI